MTQCESHLRKLVAVMTIVMLASACAPAQPSAPTRSTGGPNPTAVPTSPPALVAWPGSADRAVETVVSYLNADPAHRASLPQLLQGWDTPGTGPKNALTEVDLTGDGQPELLLGIVEPNVSSNAAGPRGQVVALHLENGQYRAVSIPAPATTGVAGGPIVQQVVDVNRDGAAEVLTISQECGASTCATYPAIASWAGGAYRLLTPPRLAMANATVTLEDRDGDGRLELVLQGGQTGANDAGPQRSRTEIYRFVGGRYERAETQTEPTMSRFLTIMDGTAAYQRKDYRTAETLYERAASDASLSDSRPSGGPDPGPGLRAFARFRLLLVYVLQGRDDEARSVLERMQSLDTATPYPAAAEVFWHTYGQTGSLEAGCRQFTEAVARQPGLLEPLTGWGADAQEMRADQLCSEP